MNALTKRLILCGLAICLGILAWASLTSGGGADQPTSGRSDGMPPAPAGIESASVRRTNTPEQPDTLGREEGHFPPTAPKVPTCAGRVLLLDDTPVADCRIVAVQSDYSPSISALQQSWASEPGALASTMTGTDGEFTLLFERHRTRIADLTFRIFHLGSNLPSQLDTLYRLDTAQNIVHRLPAGQVVVEARFADGSCAPKAIVWLQPKPGSGSVGLTAANGRCAFVIAEPMRFDVSAYQGAMGRGASIADCEFDPNRRCVVSLELTAMDRGAFRVRIVDQHEQPVTPFALRIRWHGELVRHLTEADLGGGSVVAGLPEAMLSVDVDRHYSHAPTMYWLPKRSDRRWITPNPTASEELVFRVVTYARLAFDVARRNPDRDANLAVFVRSELAGPQGDWRRVGVEQYQADGSTASTSITGDGSWFTEPIEPGLVEVQVRQSPSEAVVFGDWVQLVAGQATARSLKP